MLLVWTENLSVKIKELDDDHKKLIKVINELHYAILDAAPSGKVEPVEIEIALHRLENYARVHFDREEKILAAADHGDLAAQREAHRRMVHMVGEMGVRFRDSSSPQDAAELMNFAYDWITNHVYVSDQKWAQDLYAANTSGTSAQQSRHAETAHHPRIARSGDRELGERDLDTSKTTIAR